MSGEEIDPVIGVVVMVGITVVVAVAIGAFVLGIGGGAPENTTECAAMVMFA